MKRQLRMLLETVRPRPLSPCSQAPASAAPRQPTGSSPWPRRPRGGSRGPGALLLAGPRFVLPALRPETGGSSAAAQFEESCHSLVCSLVSGAFGLCELLSQRLITSQGREKNLVPGWAKCRSRSLSPVSSRGPGTRGGPHQRLQWAASPSCSSCAPRSFLKASGITKT